mmetsp:Transcript_99672/g.157765  ORF Transcript_99672/g.157765 Transcript_99672/m.157765 type:complete len:410 (+) Transcript_99672:63-1292(+)
MPAFKETKHVRAPSSDARAPNQVKDYDPSVGRDAKSMKETGTPPAPPAPGTPPVPNLRDTATTPTHVYSPDEVDADEGVAQCGPIDTQRTQQTMESSRLGSSRSKSKSKERKIRSPREEPLPPIPPPGTPPPPTASSPHLGPIEDFDNSPKRSPKEKKMRSPREECQPLESAQFVNANVDALMLSNSQGYPAQDPSSQGRGNTFTVKMNKKPGMWFGMRTCWADGSSLIICAIFSDGLVNEYNRTLPANPIQVGDRIVGFNGKALPLEQLKEAITTAAGDFTFELRPATVFTVNVVRESKNPVGLDVASKPYDDTLLINVVLKGLIMDWNNQSNSYRVTAGDRVIAVNNEVGPGRTLRQMIKDARGNLALTIIRNLDPGEVMTPAPISSNSSSNKPRSPTKECHAKMYP